MALSRVVKEMWNGVITKQKHKPWALEVPCMYLYDTHCVYLEYIQTSLSRASSPNKLIFLQHVNCLSKSFSISSSPLSFYTKQQSAKHYLVHANDGQRSANLFLWNHPAKEEMNHWHYLSFECINDELEWLGLNALNAFLYNVVSILIFHAFQNMAIQLLHHFILKKPKIILVFMMTFPPP